MIQCPTLENWKCYISHIRCSFSTEYPITCSIGLFKWYMFIKMAVSIHAFEFDIQSGLEELLKVWLMCAIIQETATFWEHVCLTTEPLLTCRMAACIIVFDVRLVSCPLFALVIGLCLKRLVSGLWNMKKIDLIELRMGPRYFPTVKLEIFGEEPPG